jgi:hypothetical protein
MKGIIMLAMKCHRKEVLKKTTLKVKRKVFEGVQIK